jgi:tetratricopeptide (TPR) repeat protein
MSVADSPFGWDASLSATNTGNAAADRGGKANTGIWIEEHHYLPPSPPPAWPIRVGLIPALATAFQPRPGLCKRVDAAQASADSDDTGRCRGGGVVLTQVLSGGGGVGKSQLAASYADQAIRGGTDLVVWVDAATPGALITAYAHAAARVQAPGADGRDTETDARAFLDWAATTDRSWLVVLDDITDPTQAAQWWPATHRRTGWVLATTRRRDAILSGGGRRVIDVDVYTPSEAIRYLTQRLSDVGKAHLLDERAGELAQAVGYLPLALSHAAAYMIDQKIRTGSYLDLYTAGTDGLDELMPGDPDGHGRALDGHTRKISITLLLALDAADTCAPVGLARPAMDLAAVLDPIGHPETLWATDAVINYLTAYRTSCPPGIDADEPEVVTPRQARDAVLLLDRYGLVTLKEKAGPRALQVHALTARAARENAPAGTAPAAAWAMADAVLAVWPQAHHIEPDLTAALRANTGILISVAGDALWDPEQGGHPLLRQAGLSLLHAGLQTAGITYWKRIANDAVRILGAEHPDALTAQNNLAAAYLQTGRAEEAITILKQVAADRKRLLGADHLHTLTAQANLAATYAKLRRIREAISILEPVAALMERIPEAEPSDVLTAQANLAAYYAGADRIEEAISILESVADKSGWILGPEDPATLRVQSNLAASYRQVGRAAEAIVLGERLVATMERVLGPEHPDTLTAQSNLVAHYAEASQPREAIVLGERLVATMERVLGPEHPDTLTAQANLAALYPLVDQIGRAIVLGKRVAADRVRLVGPEHPDTLTTQANLVASYFRAGQTREAIVLGERLVATMERVLGTEHASTVAVASALQKWRTT